MSIPRTVTKTTTHKLSPVKTLLNLVDSFTPMARIRVTRAVMAKAVKSGYGDRNDTCIGM